MSWRAAGSSRLAKRKMRSDHLEGVGWHRSRMTDDNLRIMALLSQSPCFVVTVLAAQSIAIVGLSASRMAATLCQ